MLSSCKKEIEQPFTPEITKGATNPSWHLYTDTATGAFSYFSYQTQRQMTKPSVSNAWYVIAGTGNSSEKLHTTTLCNQFLGFSRTGSSFVAAPVTKFFKQKLGIEGHHNIPENVSCITYDHAGNAIWLHLEPTIITRVNETRLEFSGTSTVLGGTGIFEGATGTVSTNGYFNLLDGEDAAIGHRGTILY
jgi:hypothetical protein